MMQSALIRTDTWRADLSAALAVAAATPFAWGAHDCLVGLVGHAVAALTGQDVVAPWRDRYATGTGALRVLRRDGFATLADLMATLLPEHEHPSRASVGDVVAVPSEDGFGFGLGVLDYERVFLLPETGLITVDRSHAARAWQVGA